MKHPCVRAKAARRRSACSDGLLVRIADESGAGMAWRLRAAVAPPPCPPITPPTLADAPPSRRQRRSCPTRAVKKVVLAYSGGLDTSIILNWLQTDLWLRGRDLHRRSRPGRGARAGARQGRAARHQAGEHLHRGSARGVRPRLRLPDVPRQRALRGPLPARHLDRAAADRQAADRDRARRSAPTRSATAPPARATTRSASSSATMRSKPDIKVIAPWREWDLTARAAADRVRREAPDPDRQGQARRGAVLGRRQPAALLLRGQGARGPVRSRRRTTSISAPIAPEDAPDKPTMIDDRLRAGRSRSRSTARRCRRRRCSTQAQRARPATTASAASTSSRTASSA